MNALLSTTQAAKILGISRIALFQKIKQGKIKAKKVGRNYVIRSKDLGLAGEEELTKQQKQQIEKAVAKVMKDYAQTLKMLKDE